MLSHEMHVKALLDERSRSAEAHRLSVAAQRADRPVCSPRPVAGYAQPWSWVSRVLAALR
jgi:hypothetical protein